MPKPSQPWPKSVFTTETQHLRTSQCNVMMTHNLLNWYRRHSWWACNIHSSWTIINSLSKLEVKGKFLILNKNEKLVHTALYAHVWQCSTKPRNIPVSSNRRMKQRAVGQYRPCRHTTAMWLSFTEPSEKLLSFSKLQGWVHWCRKGKQNQPVRVSCSIVSSRRWVELEDKGAAGGNWGVNCSLPYALVSTGIFTNIKLR